ncbi:hypothetical protein [Aeromonas hydrophila]
MAYSNSKVERAQLDKLHKSGSATINKIEQALYETIKDERSLRTIDMVLVKQLAAQLYINNECLKDIITNGASVQTEGREGTVIKENPSSRNFQASSTQIQKLYKQLGLEQKEIQTEDGDDPLTKALNNLNDDDEEE